MSNHFRATGKLLFALLAAGAVGAAPAYAQLGPITFTDVAGGAGIGYRRGPSERDAKAEAAYRTQPFTFSGTFQHGVPPQTRLPGVALLDYDRDGDVDVFASNGPSVRGDPTKGPGHSLYRNLLRETGRVRFEDVSAVSGVQARDHSGAGVAYGDLDNDGDADILVLGDNEPSRLFANRGNGTFADVSAASGLAQDSGPHASASLGDVNGDGLLDVVVAQVWRYRSWDTCFHVYPDARDIGRKQLFLNLGGLRFRDASADSGIQDTRWFRDAAGPRPDLDGLRTISYATAVVDYDQDGDQDVVFGDDQCASAQASRGGVDRGPIRLFRNDGAGRLTDVSGPAGTAKPGAHFGLAFADFDHNGALDIFAANVGDYHSTNIVPYSLGEMATRTLFGRGDGTFADPGATDVKATTFGRGSAALDYDNDGFTDEAYQGGNDVSLFIDRSNPGTLLRNRGGSAAGRFDLDLLSYLPLDSRVRRNVIGLATGDVDGNGFGDLVSVAQFRVPLTAPPLHYTTLYGAAADLSAFYFQRMLPLNPLEDPPERWLFSGLTIEAGTLAVELNSGNGNSWLKVRTVGTVGITGGGRVNRDGIGAVVTATPAGGEPATMPVLSGGSTLSQHDLTLGFGLGSATRGTVEVMWPGKVRNRLYDVSSGESVVFPEIPCSFDGYAGNRGAYTRCVTEALDDAVQAAIVEPAASVRLRDSALRAYDEIRAG